MIAEDLLRTGRETNRPAGHPASGILLTTCMGFGTDNSEVLRRDEGCVKDPLIRDALDRNASLFFLFGALPKLTGIRRCRQFRRWLQYSKT
jgi:hypothetical protein